MNKVNEQGNMFIIQHDLNPNAAKVTRAMLENMYHSWEAVPLVECLGHSHDHAYRYPKVVKPDEINAQGCLIAGRNTCINMRHFDSKDSCKDAIKQLRIDLDVCQGPPEKEANPGPIDHCIFGDRLLHNLYGFCNTCDTKGKPKCESKNFVHEEHC